VTNEIYENTGIDLCNTNQQDALFYSQFAFVLAGCLHPANLNV